MFYEAEANNMISFPAQVISCTNRDGTIIPISFKFEDSTGVIRSYEVICIKNKQECPRFTIKYDVLVEEYGYKRTYCLFYRIGDHEWSLLFDR